MRQLLSEQVSKLDKKISELQLIRRSVCEFIKGHSLIDTSILNKSLQTQYDKEASISMVIRRHINHLLTVKITYNHRISDRN